MSGLHQGCSPGSRACELTLSPGQRPGPDLQSPQVLVAVGPRPPDFLPGQGEPRKRTTVVQRIPDPV